MRGIQEVTVSRSAQVLGSTHRRRFAWRRVPVIAALLALTLFASACSRTHTHESDSSTAYDSTGTTTGESYSVQTAPDFAREDLPNEQEGNAYSGTQVAKASYNGQDENGAGASEARGSFSVSTSPGTEGYYGAAFFFRPGTLSGTTSGAQAASQKGRVDILRWDNASSYANKDIGGVRINADHTANLFWDGPNTAEATIGQSFLLREGCWNWLFVHQKQGDAGSAINEVFLNGEKLFSSTAKNIETGRIIDRVSFGLPGISSAQAGNSLDVYVDDAHVGASNSSIIDPRNRACEPQTGARPYYKIDDQQLSDRMGMGVNVATGNLLLTESDVQIAGTKLDLTLSRTYNSARLEQSNMGAGWVLSGGRDVSVKYDSGGDAIFRGPTGERVEYTKDGSDFDSPTGFRDTRLTKAGDGTSKLEFLGSRTKLNFHSAGSVYHGSISSIVDKNDNTIDFNYNSTTGAFQSVTDTQNRNVTATTNAGNVTQLTDFDTPTARTWEYTIVEGELDEYENPEGDETLYDYNGPNDRLTQITDPNGHQTQIVYESAYPYRVKEIKRAPGQPEAATWKFDYSSDGDQNVCDKDDEQTRRGKTVVTDPENHPTTYCWDAIGRVHVVRDAKNEKRSTKYDFDSNATEFTRGTAISNATYGAEGKLQETKSPSDVKTSFSYDNDNTDHPHFPDRITTASQQGGSGQFKDLDYFDNNLKGVDNADGSDRTSMEYTDDTGQLESVIPPRGQGHGDPPDNPYATRYEYSPTTGGNLAKIDRPSPLGDETFTYDALSRVKTRTDGQGHVQTYEYDKMDHIQRIGYKNSAGGAEVSSIQYDYDNNGNMVCRGENGDCEDPGLVETDYQYDRLNRLIFEDMPDSGVEGDSLYTYDRVGNLKTFTEAANAPPGGQRPRITYTYDEVNNLKEMRDPDNLLTQFKYEDEHNTNRTATIFPTGVRIDQTFDKDDRITSIKAKNPAGTDNYVELQYFYKNAPQGVNWPASGCGNQPLIDTGQLTCVKDLEANTTTKYKYYPNTNRLEEADTTGGSSPTDYKYYYDGNSNRTKQDVITSSGTTTTHYYYDPADRLCWSSATDGSQCTPGPTGSTSYSFTTSGNQTGYSGGCAMSYNTRDQNTSITGCGGANANSVGYLGPSNVERIVSDDVTFTNSALGLVKRHNPNDPGNPVFFRRDDNGKLVQGFRSTATGAFSKYYYVHDQLGSVIALTDSTGALMRTYSYDPYGNVTDTDRSEGGNAPTDRFRYVEGYQASGNLYHFGFRLYDAKTTRFTQPDPMDQPGANRFMYAGADPINNSDPQGLFPNPIDEVSDGISAVGDYLSDARNREQVGLITAGAVAMAGSVAIVGACSGFTGMLATAHCATAGAPLWLGGSLLLSRGVNYDDRYNDQR